jgi:hypothetical protein
VYLSTASDRIRALFIAAVFRKSAKAYANGKYDGRERGWYTTPFVEAKNTLPNASTDLAGAFVKAARLAVEIRKLRHKRNELIHERATSMGRRRLVLLDQRPQSFKPRDIDFSSLQKLIKENDAKHRHELSDTIKQLAEWYNLLVRASNEVFIVEHYRRSQPT